MIAFGAQSKGCSVLIPTLGSLLARSMDPKTMVICLTATLATQNRPGTISYDYTDGTRAQIYLNQCGRWVGGRAHHHRYKAPRNAALKKHPDFTEKFSLWA